MDASELHTNAFLLSCLLELSFLLLRSQKTLESVSHTSYMFLAGDSGVPGAPGVPGVSTGKTILYIISNHVLGILIVIFTSALFLETLPVCEQAAMADKYTRTRAKTFIFINSLSNF